MYRCVRTLSANVPNNRTYMPAAASFSQLPIIKKTQKEKIVMKNRQRTLALVVSAMLSAVAFVLMFVEFPLPMLIPSFVKMDFSDLPALLGAYALGPWYGVIIELVKNLLNILIKGTSSAYVGELFNFACGAVFCLVSGYIYKFKKTRKGAVIASLAGCLAMALFSLPLNYYVVYPAYVVCYGLPMNVIIGMYQAILPAADTLVKCLLIFNVPFTFFKGLCDAALCFLIYKPLSRIIKSFD
jgi:riboflavin transporter FmnP